MEFGKTNKRKRKRKRNLHNKHKSKLLLHVGVNNFIVLIIQRK